MIEGIDVLGHTLGILVGNQLPAIFLRRLVAQLVHVAELPAGVDMHEREWRLRGIEGLERQMQHDRRILAPGEQQHRPLELGGDLTHDVD